MIGFLAARADPGLPSRRTDTPGGVGAAPAILFGVIGWGDYADGIAARLTGQYSRLGALMDPVTDRLLLISGVVVTWHFELLPRWALAVLAAREVAMLIFGRSRSRGACRSHQLAREARRCAARRFDLLRAVGLGTLGRSALRGLALALVGERLYARFTVAWRRIDRPDSLAQLELVVYTRLH